jgi:hypothetical protein
MTVAVVGFNVGDALEVAPKCIRGNAPKAFKRAIEPIFFTTRSPRPGRGEIAHKLDRGVVRGSHDWVEVVAGALLN